MSELDKIVVMWKDNNIYITYKHNGKTYIVGGGNVNTKKQNAVFVGKAVRETLKRFGVGSNENRETDDRQD